MYRIAFAFVASAALFGATQTASAQSIPGNHYLCFPPRDGTHPQIDVQVAGPIGAGNLEVLDIVEICGAVEKIYKKTKYPIDPKYPAIVCYAIKSSEFKVKNFATEDQFGEFKSAISQPRELCLPAKLKV